VVSVAAQVRKVNKYRLDWDYQRDFYWQMAWRAPALPPGTAIFSTITPTDKLSDYSTAYALNTLYAVSPLDQAAPYWYLVPRSLGYHFSQFAPAVSIHYTFRNITFTGNTSQAIAVIYRPARACLRLLDPVYSLDPRLEPDDLTLLPVSNPGQVLAQDQTPRQDVFGAEPTRGWCYYFQKADLARSQQDWSAVLALMQQAEAAGMTPKDGAELLPLIEAYAHMEQWQAALDASQRALQITSDLGDLLCANWRRFSQLDGGAAIAQQASGLFACPAE